MTVLAVSGSSSITAAREATTPIPPINHKRHARKGLDRSHNKRVATRSACILPGGVGLRLYWHSYRRTCTLVTSSHRAPNG